MQQSARYDFSREDVLRRSYRSMHHGQQPATSLLPTAADDMILARGEVGGSLPVSFLDHDDTRGLLMQPREELIINQGSSASYIVREDSDFLMASYSFAGPFGRRLSRLRQWETALKIPAGERTAPVLSVTPSSSSPCSSFVSPFSNPIAARGRWGPAHRARCSTTKGLVAILC